MKLPIRTPALTEKKSDERQVFALVNDLRTAATLSSRVRVRGNTAGDGNYVSLWTDTLSEGSYLLSISVLGRGTTGGAWYYEQIGLQNFGGVITIIGTTANTITREDNAAMDEKIVVTGSSVSLQVRDDGVQPMSWTAIVDVLVAG